MREKTLRNIALVCFMAGLIMLFFVSRNLESEPTRIGDITIDDLDSIVRVCGRVTGKSISKDEHIFLRIRDETGGIKAVIFKDDVENLKRYKIDAYDVLEGDEICIRGEVKEWEKEIEIIVDWIEV